jgi:putative ABC transport system permease protein
MLIHYFKIALRNLGKQKGLTFINIFGLSLGIACFSLFVLYALNEFNYDGFHTNKENIYRAYRLMEQNPGEYNGSSYLPIPLGPAMKQDLPGIKDYVRFKGSWSGSYIRIDDKINNIPVEFADPNIFTVFTFPFKYGNPASALKDKHSVVLTEKTAEKLFATENPIGRTMEIKVDDKFETFQVTGVCKDLPSNSTLKFEILGNFEHFLSTPGGKAGENEWRRSGYQTYIQLESGSGLPQNVSALKKFYNKYYPKDNSSSYFGLLKMEAIHHDGQFGGDGNDPKNIFILIAISFGILLIACINFTTLAIGRSAGRAKEVGVRKVIGGTKKSLILQFMAEAILLSVLSSLAGLLLGNLLLPYFNELSGKNLNYSFQQFPEMKWFLLGLTVFVGLLAGSYPALVLSSFRPIEVLKRKLKLSGSNAFTKSLVTFQFALSIALIISTVIILQQLSFVRSMNPGFNKENLIVIEGEDVDPDKVYPVLRHKLLSDPAIKSVGASDIALGEGRGWSMSSFEHEKKQKEAYMYFVDQNYMNALGLKLIAGQSFDRDFSNDSNTIIINEAMMRDFGWNKQTAIGQILNDYAEDLKPVVIGVVKDFNFKSLHSKVEPQLFHHFKDHNYYKYFIRTEPGKTQEAIAAIEKAWKQIVPELPVKYSFLDEDLDRFYKSEARWASIIGWAGGISIFLACLGLLGLASLSAINRIKEIGVRKVLGASVVHITKLLSRDFVKLICIAILIASPIAWFFMNKWLQDFAYRINVAWWIFFLVGGISLVIAVITISFQSVKAASANPVKSLRTE